MSNQQIRIIIDGEIDIEKDASNLERKIRLAMTRFDLPQVEIHAIRIMEEADIYANSENETGIARGLLHALKALNEKAKSERWLIVKNGTEMVTLSTTIIKRAEAFYGDE